MRWICKECRHPTSGSWCALCKRNTAVFTSADFGLPRDPKPVEQRSVAEVDAIVTRIVKTFGGVDPG